MSDDQLPAADDEAPGGVVEFFGNAVGDHILGLPTPVRRNLWKALGRLIMAAADAGTAHLEASAGKVRGRAKGRQTIVDAMAREAAKSVKGNAALVDRAMDYLVGDIVRSQKNREAVARLAASELVDKKAITGSSDEIDDDWIAAFWQQAGQKSNDEIRLYFAKVLAGEIAKPGSFSVSAINALAAIRPNTARVFQRLCNTSIQCRFGTFASWRCAFSRDISITDIYELQALGLVAFDSWMSIRLVDLVDGEPGTYAGHSISLRRLVPGQQAGVGGVSFLPAGVEIRAILALEPDWEGAALTVQDFADGKVQIEFEGKSF